MLRLEARESVHMEVLVMLELRRCFACGAPFMVTKNSVHKHCSRLCEFSGFKLKGDPKKLYGSKDEKAVLIKIPTGPVSKIGVVPGTDFFQMAHTERRRKKK